MDEDVLKAERCSSDYSSESLIAFGKKPLRSGVLCPQTPPLTPSVPPKLPLNLSETLLSKEGKEIVKSSPDSLGMLLPQNIA